MPPAAGGTAPDEGLTGFHPAFRILLLLVMAGMVFRYSLPGLALLLAVLLAGAAMAGGDTVRGILRSVRRIRWLLLSIVVIYLWVAPEPPTDGQPWFLPGWGDLEIALRRSGVLVVLVAAVELLRRRTAVTQVAAGLVMLLSPLARVGVDTGVFARRLALTLEAVPLTAERVAHAAGEHRIRRGLAGWGEAAAGLIRDIETGAAGAPRAAELPALPRPAARDWLLLGAGIAACVLVGRL